jgi:hypothetical protein
MFPLTVTRLDSLGASRREAGTMAANYYISIKKVANTTNLH